MAPIDEANETDGPFYLFTLRLIPILPFFAVNLLMGLTQLKTKTFYWVSQLGMLLGTAVYVNVGTQLAGLTSLKGILSAPLIGSFVLLGILPLIAKKIVDYLNARKVYAGWTKPAKFDRNVVVIGAGSAGLVSSLIAATVNAKVTLIERHKMGGDCLNTGCVPSKALIKSAKLMHQASHSADYGIRAMKAELDFADVMERIQRVIKTVEPHDSVERFTSLGVECMQGNAKIVSPWEVEVSLTDHSGKVTGSRRLTTRNIVIAAGARPLMPPIPGLNEVKPYTSDDLWTMRVQPKRLLVLGGGPIGCELTQAFARLGSKVTQVEMAPQIMGREDPEVSEQVRLAFVREGIDVRVNHKAVRFEVSGDSKALIAEADGKEVRIEFDVMICALGRVANTAGYGLEELKVPLAKTRTVEVNEYLQTRFPNIFACGDVAGPYQFTHTASHMAWFATVNALFGRFKKYQVDYSVVPWATFTDPEVARVGLSETEAKQKNIAYEVTRYNIDDLDRAIADEAAHGFVKVLTVPGKDKILGATIVGEHAGDLIAEYVSAMKHGLGLKKIMATIHIYPTLTEANKFAASEWQKAHKPVKLLQWVGRYHSWQRG